MSKPSNLFSPAVRDRAERLVGEHRGNYAPERAALTLISGKTGWLFRSKAKVD